MIPKVTPIIEVRHLYKTYYLADNVEQLVLKDINCTVNSGEFIAIMGHSGSGKSTLMNILGGLDRLTQGAYFFMGKDVAQLSDDDLARLRGCNVGFVFQNFNLIMKRSIADNVALPLVYQGVSETERHQRAIEILKQVNLEGYENRLPCQISGGMQQRVAIARALINRPKIIFADEPTGNLDTATSHEIMDILADLHQQGITIVLVTHEDDIANYAQRMIKIVDGQKAFDGAMTEYRKKSVC